MNSELEKCGVHSHLWVHCIIGKIQIVEKGIKVGFSAVLVCTRQGWKVIIFGINQFF